MSYNKNFSISNDGNLPSTKANDLNADQEKVPKFLAPTSKIKHNSEESSFHVSQTVSLNQPLDPKSFPQQSRDGGRGVLATIPNLEHMLSSYGIIVQYDVITNRIVIRIPGNSQATDFSGDALIAQIISLANLNAMPIGQISSFLDVIGSKNPLNSVADWITSKPWDGKDRLQSIYDSLTSHEDFPERLKNQLIYRWLLSAVAATLKPSGFKARGVLTLQGPQNIGKTSWISNLITEPLLRESVLKLDHHLDAGNKDSIITAISHWIVEIGELDSSFKKDIARLKGFLTADRDKVRRPYGRADSEYPRHTVFCATVNEHNFLVDPTGNSRWWTIPLTSVNYQHGIDMQQLFAQLAIKYNQGEQWWLTPEEEHLLEVNNKNHRSVSVIRERILEAFDMTKMNANGLPAMTASQLLMHLDFNSPTNPQSRECGAVMRELLGEPKKINGQYKWRIPLKAEALRLFNQFNKQDEPEY